MSKSKYVDIPAIMQVIGNVYNDLSLLDNQDYFFNEEDFSANEFHRILFGAMYNLHDLGAKEINLNAIEDYLTQRPQAYGVFKANRGIEYLTEISKVAKRSTFDYYYQRMKKFTLLRMYSEQCHMDLSDLYDADNMLDQKKKQYQENWLDAHTLEEIADIIDGKIVDIRLKYVDDASESATAAGDGVLELLTRLKEVPEIGYPLYGRLINTVTRGARLKKFYLRSAATGLGKAIPNDALIPTPDGWREVRDIRVGDYLFGQDGKPTKVLAIYPQPEQKEIWKITFSDGRVAECCGEHLWEYSYESHRGRAYRVESTQTLYERALSLKNGFKDSRNKGFRFHIKIAEPVSYSKKEYDIPPYVMGALLGDGSFRYSLQQKALSFSSKTDELPNKIANLLPGDKYIAVKSSDYNYSYTFKPISNLKHNLWVEELLKNYPELWQAKSETKFIPKSYLIGDIFQRFELLRGLLDTDGTIDEKGRVEFTTVSPRLRDDVIELVRSLGMTATYLTDKRNEKYTTGECYVVHIQSKKILKPLMFSLDYKIDTALNYAKSDKRSEYKDHLAIVDIEKTIQLADMTCFTVDNADHLFLMNDYIVTHNTRTMVADATSIACDEIYDSAQKKWIKNGTREPAILITTEQEKEEIQTMVLAFLSEVNEEHIVTGNYYLGEWERVVYAAKVLQRCPLYIQQLPDFSLEDIENTIKRGIRDYKCRYIFFDYLHSSMKILGEISSKAGVKGLREDNILFMISTRLKDLCNEYGVFILTSTQLNADYTTAQVYDQNLLRGAKAIAD